MPKRLAQTLLAEKLVEPAHVEDALQRQVVYGGSLDTNLLEAGYIAETALLEAIRKTHGLPTAGRAEIDAIGEHIPRLFPQAFAETYHLVPKDLRKETLEVVVAGAPDAHLFERIYDRLRLRLEPVLTTEVRMHYAMHRLYGTSLLPRYRNLIVELDGELPAPAVPPPPGTESRVLSWGLSKAHIVPSRTRGDSSRAGLDVRGLLSRVDSAIDRDTIVEILLGATLAIFDFGGLFLVHAGSVNGWRGTDPDATQRISRICLALEMPSVFQTVYATGGHYLGPLPTNSVNTKLLADLGRPTPRAAFVAPVMVADRLAAILFADNGARSISPKRVAAMLVLLQRSGMALERLIRRRKAAATRLLQPASRAADAAAAAAGQAGADDVIQPEGAPVHETEFELITDEVLESVPPAAQASEPAPQASASAAEAPVQAETVEPGLALPERRAVTAPAEGPEADELGDEDEDWESVSLGELDTSPRATAKAFRAGLETAPDGEAVDDSYVAFEGVDSSPQQSVDEWEDVLDDTAAAAVASAAPAPEQTRAGRAASVTWDEVVAEAESAAAHVWEPAVQSIEVAGTVLNEEELLFDSLEAADPQTRHDAVHALLARGSAIDEALRERFPGHLDFDPLAADTRVPPLAQCNGLQELLVVRGVAAAPLVLPFLDADDPVQRFFAIYFVLTVPHPPAIEGLAKRLYDTEPRNRYFAAEALRRYAREPAYRRIVEGLRAQLKTPVLESQMAAAQILGQLREPAAVPSLIPLMAAKDPDLVGAAASALAVICAQDFSADVHRWAEWWQGAYARPRPTWLIEGLRHGTATIRRIANSELQLLTGRTANFEADAPLAQREAAIRLWEAWWQQVSAPVAASSAVVG